MATPAPTYVLIADRSSLVMRPPYIRSQLTLIESVIGGVRQDGIRLSLIFLSQIENTAQLLRSETAAAASQKTHVHECWRRTPPWLQRETALRQRHCLQGSRLLRLFFDQINDS